MHPAKAKEPWSGDRLQIPEFHEISESCKTRIRQLLRSPYDSGRKSCWNARDLKQALNIHVLGSTTGTNLRSHSITTFNHYDRRTTTAITSGILSHPRCGHRYSRDGGESLLQLYIHVVLQLYIFVMGKKGTFWTLGVKIELL
jgi:hypothetical protein